MVGLEWGGVGCGGGGVRLEEGHALARLPGCCWNKGPNYVAQLSLRVDGWFNRQMNHNTDETLMSFIIGAS